MSYGSLQLSLSKTSYQNQYQKTTTAEIDMNDDVTDDAKPTAVYK